MMRMSKDSLPLIPEANIAKGNTEDTGLEGKLLLNIIDFFKTNKCISGILGYNDLEDWEPSVTYGLNMKL